MKKRSRFGMIFTAIIMTAVMTCGALTGCRKDRWKDRLLPEYESGYFRYALRKYKDGTKEAFLMGLTELGEQQTELIMPSELDGIPVIGMGYMEGSDIFAVIGRARIESENLKKIYIPFSIRGWYREYATIIPDIVIVQWRGDQVWNAGGGDARVVGYNVFKDLYYKLVYYGGNYNDKNIANVAYLINYEITGGDGYYWVDSYDNGVITFIPPEPTREGYAFQGWYKEAECINEWDFETDRTGDEIPIIEGIKMEDYDDSGITYLYAKWEKN